MKLKTLGFAAAFLGSTALTPCVLAPPARADFAQEFIYTTPKICTGDPWYDVRCAGAVGDGSTDDAAALNTAGSTAFANDWPLYLPHLRFKVLTAVTWQIATPFQGVIISNNAAIDGGSISGSSVLVINCGSHASPNNCLHTRINGPLTVNGASTSNAVVQIGFGDLVDSFLNLTVDKLIVSNSGSGTGCTFGKILTSDITASCQGATSGIQYQQVTDTRARLIANSTGTAFSMDTSTNYGNLIHASFAGGGRCINIATASSSNTFASPDLVGCSLTDTIHATAGSNNTLISPVKGSQTAWNASTANLVGISIINDPISGDPIAVPALTTTPQIQIGGTGTSLAISNGTFAARTAPSTPSSGTAILYLDVADGKWKVKFSSGTVKTVASP